MMYDCSCNDSRLSKEVCELKLNLLVICGQDSLAWAGPFVPGNAGFRVGVESLNESDGVQGGLCEAMERPWLCRVLVRIENKSILGG